MSDYKAELYALVDKIRHDGAKEERERIYKLMLGFNETNCPANAWPDHCTSNCLSCIAKYLLGADYE